MRSVIDIIDDLFLQKKSEYLIIVIRISNNTPEDVFMYKAQLRTFITVCETGSFSKAAAELFITPSAVIQQINSLEKDLSVTLFNRSQKGVSLTEAGEYLSVQGKDLIRISHQIRRQLLQIASRETSICIGTSLTEKCRLLYDLWVLFSEREKNYEISMVNIESDHTIPARADLVESVNGSVPWTTGWNFLEICQVPFGFAFHKDHPLAQKKTVTLDDLKKERIVSMNRGSSPEIQKMLTALHEHGIQVDFYSGSGSSVIWECAFQHRILVCPVCWSDILVNMEMRPCQWHYTMPYGIFYRPDPSPAVQKFLDFITETYKVGNEEGITPLLNFI